jgi:23S rRNA pseudouridine1911/1915/1917 synthase
MKPSSTTAQTALITVKPGEGGQRLDVFLSTHLKAFSRNQAQTLVKEGNVIPQFPVKALKVSLVVSEGQTFRVNIPPSKKSDILAQDIKLDIVFEDASLLVINKPVGMVVHPGAGNPDKTLINALMAHCPDIAGVGGVQRPGLVHRLDKDTSGLLVVAKTDAAYKSLVKQLRYRKLSREYLGIVKGEIEGPGTVNAPLGRHFVSRKRMAVIPEGGKIAVTHFAVLEKTEKASLLHLKLETGRTHQIRVHMQYIHHPILGDTVYGGASDLAPRQMLHAFRLSFQHPKTGITKTYTVLPPVDFEECLVNLDLNPPKWKGLVWEK